MDPERKVAIEARFRGRVSWLAMVGAVLAAHGLALDGRMRAVLVGVLVVAVAWLNGLLFGAVRRALREKVAPRIVRLLALPLVLRGLALVGIVLHLASL